MQYVIEFRDFSQLPTWTSRSYDDWPAINSPKIGSALDIVHEQTDTIDPLHASINSKTCSSCGKSTSRQLGQWPDSSTCACSTRLGPFAAQPLNDWALSCGHSCSGSLATGELAGEQLLAQRSKRKKKNRSMGGVIGGMP
eukprot:gene9866-10024_t